MPVIKQKSSRFSLADAITEQGAFSFINTYCALLKTASCKSLKIYYSFSASDNNRRWEFFTSHMLLSVAFVVKEGILQRLFRVYSEQYSLIWKCRRVSSIMDHSRIRSAYPNNTRDKLHKQIRVPSRPYTSSRNIQFILYIYIFVHSYLFIMYIRLGK